MSKRRVPPGDRTVAVAYLRASTTDQHLSPEVQTATIRGWAERQGIRMASWFTDQGVSGGSELDDRPALGEALASLRSIGAGVFVVARRDRLARDIGVAIAIERAVKAAGAVIISADGVGNGDGPAEMFSRRIQDAAAEYERGLVRLRTKGALAAKKAKGERVGGVPFGSAVADDGKQLVPNAAEEAIVAEVLSLRRAGLTIRAVVAECARRGLVSRRGKPLGKTQVERLLRRATLREPSAAA